MNASQYCTDQVRKFDRDRFLCSLFAPSSVRADLCALYAFNLDVGNIVVTTTEPLIGLMRLQWWRDTLDAVFQGNKAPVGSPVAERLAQVIQQHNLSRACLDDILDVRSEGLEAQVFADEAALDRRAEADVTVTCLALNILGVDDAISIAAGRHVGLAWGTLGLARSFPYRHQAGWHPFPQTWSEDTATVSPAAGTRITDNKWPALTERLAARVKDHLSAARISADQVTHAAAPALLPGTLADTYLRRLRRNGHDLFDTGMRAVGAGTLLKLAWRAQRGRF